MVQAKGEGRSGWKLILIDRNSYIPLLRSGDWPDPCQHGTWTCLSTIFRFGTAVHHHV